MFKLIQRHSKLVVESRLYHSFEVRCADISQFKYVKRGYHVLNINQRFCLPHTNESRKHATGNMYSYNKAPWLTGALAATYSSSGPLNVPDVPPAPIPTAEDTVVEALNALGEPTFKSLGLGGWSPIGMVQNAFEYLHVTLDIPWWSCIVIGTIVVRLCVFPLVIMAQKNNALMNNHMPQIQILQLKMTQARLSGNAYETAKCSQEFMGFMKEKGLNPLKNALPIMLQAPFFISFFLGLRRMANCPVESMKEGGLYWFTDLTIPDPLYLLPILTSLTMWITIEVGADQMKTSNQTGMLLKYGLRAIPIVMLPFTINFPGAILCYWLSTNVISLAQVGILRIPAVREYFKIPKLVHIDPSTLPSNKNKKGVVANAKESWANMRITKELEDRQRTDEMIFNKAGKGPIVKTYKFDPTKHLTSVKAKDKDTK